MHLLKWKYLRSWPAVAGILVAVFIVYGLTLISRSRQLQQKISQEVNLLDDLSQLSGSLNQLALTHRMDVGTRHYQWPEELNKVSERIVGIGQRNG